MVEPTDAVFTILKQIQETLADHSRRFDNIDGRFDRIDRRLEELHDSTITALGLAGHANVRHDAVAQRLDELTRRVEELERAR
jgi:tetrahydromethanopterin S-methyltransferase subunit G